MNGTDHPIERAKARGHKLENDPPANSLSNANRMTCAVCGRAVLWNRWDGTECWGSALEKDCEKKP